MLNLNKAKCIYKKQHVSSYAVRYKVYESPNMEFQTLGDEVINTVCYSGFFNRLGKKDNKDKKIYTETTTKTPSSGLTKKEVSDWIKICRTNGILPKYINISKSCTKNSIKLKDFKYRMVLDLENQKQSLIYMYLDTFRHLRDDPGFVKAVLYLHNEMGINFFAAFVLSSHFNITASGHHCIQVTAGLYDQLNKPQVTSVKGEMNLKMVRSMYQFINNKEAKTGELIRNSVRWSCKNYIAEITDLDLIIPVKHLDHPLVEKIITTFDDKEAKKLHTKLIKSISE